MRLAHVILDIPTRSLDAAYTYEIPEQYENEAAIGCAVVVPFGNRTALGYIIGFVDDFDVTIDVSKLKSVEAIVSESYFDSYAAALIKYIAHYYIATLASTVHLFTPVARRPKFSKDEHGVWQLHMPARRRKQKAAAKQDFDPFQPLELTPDQDRAFHEIQDAYSSTNAQSILLQGVTGSGKTEIYMQTIEYVRSRGQSAIALIPEIALTAHMDERYRARFGDDIAILHSAMTAAQRYDEWMRIKEGSAHIVLGPRSALFAPLKDLGVVIIDEEHEFTYKQSSEPRYHARDVAWFMVQQRHALLLLGSATPSLESLYECEHNPLWHRIRLPHRVNGRALPHISVVDMAREFSEGHKSMFSRELTAALFDAIHAGHHSMLFLNQRGFARFVLCRDCGYVPTCPTCSVSLTYHEHDHKLICHHCGYSQDNPARCPECSSPFLKKFGTGTQRVEAQLRELLHNEDVEIIRMDADTTKSRGSHAHLLQEFASKKASILLGTQMIAKGLDFDDIAVVGIIDADTQLKLPDFRSSERTFSLIQQVAGRAGRADIEGHVIVQTYASDEYSVKSAATYNEVSFLDEETTRRSILQYPPFVRLVNIVVWGKNNNQVMQHIQELKMLLDEKSPDGVLVYEASACALSKLKDNYRWHILIKAPTTMDIAAWISPLVRTWRYPSTLSLAIDVDPISIM